MNYYRRHPMNYYNPFLDERHKVFVSYYHDDDQYYRELFEDRFSDYYDIMVSKSVELGDIDSYLKTETIRQKIRDEYLRDSTVTVVLVGAHTWQRKFVDWEIGSSIRQTQYNSRSGLLGILLPTFRYHTVLSGTLPLLCGYPRLIFGQFLKTEGSSLMTPEESPHDSTITLNVVSPRFIRGAMTLIPCSHGYTKLSNGETRTPRPTTLVIRS